MSLNLLMILGSCVAGVFFGLLVYWIFFRIPKTPRANQSNSIEVERQTPLTPTEDIDHPSLEQPYKANHAPDIRRDAKTETQDEDWLNKGVPEVSASTLHKDDDDWLNAGLEEIPAKDYKQKDEDWLNAGLAEISAKDYKQKDEDWLNAENSQSWKNADDLLLDRGTTNYREIQIQQDDTIFHIIVNAVNKQDTKPEQTVISIRVNAFPQDLTMIEKWPYDLEITKGGLSPSYLSLQDIIAIKPLEKSVRQSHVLLDEISIKSVESQVTESHALLDEISVRPVESRATESYVLLDEITLKPTESQVDASHALLDEISIKSSPGPVNIDYELLDDLITKNTRYQTVKEAPSSEISVTKPVKRPEAKAEPVKTVSIPEITEFLNEKSVLKQATIAAEATGTSKISTLSLDIPVVTTRFRVLLLSLVYLLGMAIAEFIIYHIYPVGGIILYFVILFSLIICSIIAKVRSERDFCIALGLAPLIRIVLLAVPGILPISQYSWYIVASIPIVTGIISISRTINLSTNDMGLNFNKPFIQFLAAVTGIGLAIVDYLILKPEAWTGTFTIQEILLPAVVLMLFVGLIEELSFRGVMQRASMAVSSYGWIFIAAIYGVLQIWQGSVLHCIFCFGVSLFFGWIVKKTRSILGVSMAHGFINIGLYLVLPHIF